MNINKNQITRLARLSVIALASLLSILALTALAWPNEEQRQFNTLLELYNPSQKPDDKDKSPDKNDKKKKNEKSKHQLQAERIAKRLIFSVKKKPKGFSLKLAGILGKLVYFQKENKGFELGQTHKGAKITRIGPDWVEVDFKGKLKMLYVFGKGAAVSAPTKPAKSPPKPPSAEPEKAPPPKEIKLPKMPESLKNMKLPSGFTITSEMIERFKAMSPEMQQQLLEQMPDNIREEIEKKL